MSHFDVIDEIGMKRTPRPRLAGWLLPVSIWICLSPGQVAQARQPVADATSLVGKQVVQKLDSFALRDNNRIVDRKGILHIYRVEKASEGRLWLKAVSAEIAGWVDADQVVTVDDAIAYFTD